MTESPDETASNGDISDDARAVPSTNNNSPASADSAWTSRRGKARCDSCRLRNLKLIEESRVAIDAASPISNATERLQYTPKKRARPPVDQPQPARGVPYNTQAQTASFMFTNISGPVDAHPSYNRSFVNENASSSSRDARPMELDRGIPPYQRRPSFSEGPPLALLPAPTPPSHTSQSYQQPFISHSFPEPHQSSRIKPWSHPSFLPLPDPMLQRVCGIKSVEMPSREEFEHALNEFVSKLQADLRETACLPPEAYATLANCLSKNNITRLSQRIRAWATCHRLSSGSDKLNLIVAPREPFFQASPEEQQRMITEYRASLDRPPQSMSSPGQKSDKDNTGADTLQFERLPVQPQIYDCLVYAHRGHASSVAAMMEIRRMNISSITWPMAEIFVRGFEFGYKKFSEHGARF
ncbi:hypothetical protein MSAN_00572900 [Mycena sanguinolenta]|uniref:Uncharacterized protein n=1 Tax=Mycena sanguinolenta TaxID=230812 RepID=A0A8H6ZDE4_9AGAR|nr:hypothetical protein MSAN_00572900 [Mycena sanguinolenta]